MWFPAGEVEHSLPKTAPESSLTAKGQQENSSIAAPTVHLSRRGQHLLGQVSASPRQWGAFIPGVPDVNAFPHPLFSKIQARISRRPKPERLSYSCNGGTPELQQALVDYLRVSRGVHCQADQILITEGSTRRSIWSPACCVITAIWRGWRSLPYWGIRHVLAMNDVRVEP
ncbi:transcriptional regulator GabR [Klebsiella variicola]|uniref:Transcriptional regulator GabR n=1 Tax=Klebsiella variicola TaxID=244366 RepID=A0A7H4M951_KLEVA|nr:transcriptional regulator GabR [Klebsiella variicola]